MYQLFTQRPRNKKGLVLFPEFTYVRTGLQQESRKITRHYRMNPKVVKSNHLLVTLLNSLSVSLDSDLSTFYNSVRQQVDKLTQSLRLTSDVSAGKIHSDIFFGRGSDEIIIINDDDFDFVGIDKRWEDLEPIRVLRHPHTDTNMVIFRGDVDSRYFIDPYAVDNSGLYVVSINLPMLAVQWYYWHREIAMQGLQSIPTTMSFVATYPIVNMIYSYTDYAIFNRFVNALRGRPSNQLRNQHPFMVINYYDRLDRVIRGLVESLKHRRLDFASMLMTLPAVFNKDMFTVTFPPYYGNATRQIAWAKNIAVMPTIAMLLQLNAETENALNQHHINALRIAYRRLENDSIMDNQLDVKTLLSVKRYMSDEIAAYL